MNRISLVKDYVDSIIDNKVSDHERKDAYIHLYGVAEFCFILAGRRGLNTEIAYITGLLHDVYAYFTGSYVCHGQSGADMVRVALRKMNAFTYDERMMITSAIFHHSDKEHIHDEYDELLKDADVMQHFIENSCSSVEYREAWRLNRILTELNITASPLVIGSEKQNSSNSNFRREIFAGIAEELAQIKICGERNSDIYMNIIKYYPEETAFDELKNAWCAAFVYHCAIEAGLELPIRQPMFIYRFAGVGTWYKWAKEKGFCYGFMSDDYYIQKSNTTESWEERLAGFVPSRGDIVIYNNIIEPDYKPKDSAWHDHIGILLSCDGDNLMVAEGNADNKNVSGIIKRKFDNTIAGFIRIPDGLIYDGWKCDYKEYYKAITANN